MAKSNKKASNRAARAARSNKQFHTAQTTETQTSDIRQQAPGGQGCAKNPAKVFARGPVLKTF
jgi:hypothetical protein